MIPSIFLGTPSYDGGMPPPTPLAVVTQTQASSVYDRLRRDLLTGQLPPGRRLQLRFLMDRYEAGQTPLREALNRLAADGLVAFRDQRGFTVAGISALELKELTKTRCWLEETALRHAMAAATPAWEEQLVLDCHRLVRLHRSPDPAQYMEHPEWERLHRTFHRTLLAPCGSRPLRGFCDQLADRLYRYRQLSVQKIYPKRDVNAEHEAILAAILDRRADDAVALLQAHYRQTADIILQDLPPDDPAGTAPDGTDLIPP